MTTLPSLGAGKYLRLVQFLPDGRSIAGVAGNELFQWSPAAGRVVTELLPTSMAGQPIDAVSLSPDGNSAIMSGFRLRYRWTRGAGLVDLGSLTGYEHYLAGKVLSFDGRVIYGDSSNGESTYHFSPDGVPQEIVVYKPFRWTVDEGMESLGFAGNVSFTSDDGSVIAGQNASVEYLKSQSFVWSERFGLRSLGDLPNGSSRNYVVDGSADGRVIVGDAIDQDSTWGWRAYKWTEDAGMTSLGSLGDGSLVKDLSADGRVAIGDVIDWTPIDYGGGLYVYYAIEDPFIWQEYHGMRRLRDVLAEGGITLGTRAQGATHELLQVSPDGRLLLGSTSTSDPNDFYSPSVTTYWIVDLAVPEPSCLVPTAIAALMFLCKHRRATRRG